MRLMRSVIPSSCTVALFGDTHDGSRGYDKTGVDRLVDKIASDRNMRWAHMGDACDAICSDDKRFVFDPGVPVPLQQARSVVSTFKPIAKKGIAFLQGNHENKLHRFGDFAKELIADPLGVPYGGYVCKVQLADKFGPICKLFLWHGPIRGSITSSAKDHQQRQANMKAAVRRYLENKASDCAIEALGHVHKLILVEPAPKLLLEDDGEKLHSRYLPAPRGSETYIEPDSRWYCSTGSYLKSQMLGCDSYAELAGYDPIELGHIEIDIRDRVIAGVRRVVAS